MAVVMISSFTDRGAEMAKARKFLFETHFDMLDARRPAKEPEVVEPPEPTFSEEEIEAARAQGFVEGRNEGIAEMQSGLDQRIAAALEAIVGELQRLDAARTTSTSESHVRALELALAITRKALPALAAGQARGTIEDMVRDCLGTAIDEPRVVIRTAPAMLEQIREGIDDVAARSGFPGDIILMSDDELGEADCRVEWADGGSEQNSARVWKEIDRIVDGYLAAIRARDEDTAVKTGAADPAPTDQPATHECSPPPAEKLNG